MDSSLRPNSIDRGLSPSNQANNSMFSPITPSDMVGPSPVTSNGTETTEIEDEVSDNIQEGELSPPTTNGSSDSHATVRTVKSLTISC